MQVDYQEITNDEAKEIIGGTSFIQLAARLVDTLCDLSDDFETNGSNRPYLKYE